MKFMLSFREEQMLELQRLADERGVTIQEFFRAVVWPDWKKMHGYETMIPAKALEEKAKQQ